MAWQTLWKASWEGLGRPEGQEHKVNQRVSAKAREEEICSLDKRSHTTPAGGRRPARLRPQSHSRTCSPYQHPAKSSTNISILNLAGSGCFIPPKSRARGFDPNA